MYKEFRIQQNLFQKLRIVNSDIHKHIFDKLDDMECEVVYAFGYLLVYYNNKRLTTHYKKHVARTFNYFAITQNVC